MDVGLIKGFWFQFSLIVVSQILKFSLWYIFRTEDISWLGFFYICCPLFCIFDSWFLSCVWYFLNILFLILVLRYLQDLLPYCPQYYTQNLGRDLLADLNGKSGCLSPSEAGESEVNIPQPQRTVVELKIPAIRTQPKWA